MGLKHILLWTCAWHSACKWKYLVLTKSVHYNESAALRNNVCHVKGTFPFSPRPHMDQWYPCRGRLVVLSTALHLSHLLCVQMSLSPGWPGLLLRRHQGAVGNDMKKSNTNLMGFLRIATGPTYVSHNFIQGSSGPMGAKGNVGSPGPSGKKVSVISLRCQMLRKKLPPFFSWFPC